MIYPTLLRRLLFDLYTDMLSVPILWLFLVYLPSLARSLRSTRTKKKGNYYSLNLLPELVCAARILKTKRFIGEMTFPAFCEQVDKRYIWLFAHHFRKYHHFIVLFTFSHGLQKPTTLGLIVLRSVYRACHLIIISSLSTLRVLANLV